MCILLAYLPDKLNLSLLKHLKFRWNLENSAALHEKWPSWRVSITVIALSVFAKIYWEHFKV